MCEYCLPEDKTLVNKIARAISYGVLILIFTFIVILAFIVVLDAKNLAYGAETPAQGDIVEKSIETRLKALEWRQDEQEGRLKALMNRGLPEKIEFCGERVPQERGYVREQLEKELLMLDHKQFTLYIKRANYKYFPYIEKRLKEWKMPDCLKYIPVIESALNPNALSPAGAGSFWQFMPKTAAKYGLGKGVNWDDRADFEKATDAALSYLWDNYKLLGNWALAIAAYNAGEANIGAAVKRQKTSDYYDLWLPKETMQYNYRAIVAYIVMSQPKLFGFSLEDDDFYKWPETKKEAYKLSKPQSVFEVADHFKISVNGLLWLNPWIKAPSGKKQFKNKQNNFILLKGTYIFRLPINGKK